MSSPYGPGGGQDPQHQWGQQPYGGPHPGTPSGGFPAQGTPSGGFPAQGGYGGYGQQPEQQAPYGGYGQQQPYGGYGQQPTQQYAPYGQQQPGGYPGVTQPKKKGGAWIWIVVAVIVLAAGAVAILGFVTPGFFNKKVFDQGALEGDNGVRKVLISSYGLQKDQIQSVSCPANQEVKQGTKFQCSVKIGGDSPKEQVVDITVRNDSGEYEVGPPRDK